MCGRFVSVTDADGIARFFVVDDRQTGDLPPNPNVAPTEDVHAVVEHDLRRVLVRFRWGLVPHWADDVRIGNRLLNARAETVERKPAFRDAFARRRCLLPADGFYEWRREPDGRRIPYLFTPPPGELLAFAGLWAAWRDRSRPGEAPLRTCTIVTTTPSADVAPLHDRMPVVLPREHWAVWLDRDVSDPGTLRPLLAPAPDGALRRREVDPAVNDPRHKDLAVLA